MAVTIGVVLVLHQALVRIGVGHVLQHHVHLQVFNSAAQIRLEQQLEGSVEEKDLNYELL